MTYQLCSDIGGTFTDVYVRNDEGTTESIKTPTTPDDLTDGLFDAFQKAGAEFDVSVEGLLGDTDRLIHGTTVATNAIIEGETSKTALITTEGFRDTLTLREGGKENPYDWDMDYPDPYIPRRLTYTVPERITAEGDIETELDDQRCRRIIGEISDLDVDAIAVSLLWSHQNPVHEERIGELIEEEAPELRYSLSCEVAPIIREYRRTSATAINASLYGVVDEYLSKLEDRVETHGFEGVPFIITANGGVMQIDEVARSPIWMVDAGPTMFPVAASKITENETRQNDVIALDMGGTSLDMAVVQDGDISRSREAKVEGNHILGIEKVEIKSIGSGGGSIAWVDSGGLLHVGPESAGADPGPACYLRGGEDPTVTDAALVLGYLNEEYFLGGDMDVSREAAEAVLDEKIGAELGLDTVEAAHAIYATANQNIISGIKSVTIERGINPRTFVLSGGGGALGTHAVDVARELQIQEIVLPREAGVISAVGGLASDMRRDFSESHFTSTQAFDQPAVNSVLSSLGADAESFFDRADIPDSNRALRFFTEARYPNQVWELEVPLPVSEVDDEAVETIVKRFHQTHENTYGFRMEDQEIEFLQWRVEAVGQNPNADAVVSSMVDADEFTGATEGTERRAFFDGEAYPSSAFRAHQLGPGISVDGPAFIEAETTTVVLPPESSLEVTRFGNYRISP